MKTIYGIIDEIMNEEARLLSFDTEPEHLRELDRLSLHIFGNISGD